MNSEFEEDGSGLFLGSNSDYIKYAKKQGIEIKSADEQEKIKIRDSSRINLSSDDRTEISQETLDILKRTRLRNKAQQVYMQSDKDFYDSFYNKDLGEEDELLMEARKIKKIYKQYPDYLYALHIRELYLDDILERYESPYMLAVAMSSENRPWIPPKPMYSRYAPDYHLARLGIIDTSSVVDIDDERASNVVEAIMKEKGIDVDEVIVTQDVETDILFINGSTELANKLGDDSGIRYNNSRSVDVSDIENWRKVFTSWYQDDIADETTTRPGLFSRTPEKIREEFYKSCAVQVSGLLTKFVNGEYEEEKEDPLEMVFDPETNRPMTRKELNTRNLIKTLSDMGWNEYKLMQCQKVGTVGERRLVMQREKNKKRQSGKQQKDARSYFNETLYGDSDYNEPFTDFESLKSKLNFAD